VDRAPSANSFHVGAAPTGKPRPGGPSMPLATCPCRYGPGPRTPGVPCQDAGWHREPVARSSRECVFLSTANGTPANRPGSRPRAGSPAARPHLPLVRARRAGRRRPPSQGKRGQGARRAPRSRPKEASSSNHATEGVRSFGRAAHESKGRKVGAQERARCLLRSGGAAFTSLRRPPRAAGHHRGRSSASSTACTHEEALAGRARVSGSQPPLGAVRPFRSRGHDPNVVLSLAARQERFAFVQQRSTPVVFSPCPLQPRRKCGDALRQLPLAAACHFLSPPSPEGRVPSRARMAPEGTGPAAPESGLSVWAVRAACPAAAPRRLLAPGGLRMGRPWRAPPTTARIVIRTRVRGADGPLRFAQCASGSRPPSRLPRVGARRRPIPPGCGLRAGFGCALVNARSPTLRPRWPRFARRQRAPMKSRVLRGRARPAASSVCLQDRFATLCRDGPVLGAFRRWTQRK